MAGNDPEPEWCHYTPEGAFRGGPGQALTRAARISFVVSELRANRRALMVFAMNRFRATYRAQALGILWPMANPFILMLVMSVVFGVVFKTDIDAYPVFLMLGLVLWHFVTHALTDVTSCLVRHSEVVKRTSVPSYVVAGGTVLSHLTTLGFASLSLIPLTAFYPEAFRISPALLLMPVIVLFVLVTVLGIGLATSVLNVLYRDVGYLVDSFLLVMFWATPVVWPLERVPKSIHGILLLNPFAANLSCLRDVVMKGSPPPLSVLAAAGLSALGCLVVGMLLHRRYEPRVSDNV